MIGFIDFEHVGVDFLQNAVEDTFVGKVTPVSGALGVEPGLAGTLKGIVRLEFCPDFGEIIDAFEGLGLTALADSLFEFTIERRLSTARSAQEKDVFVQHAYHPPV